MAGIPSYGGEITITGAYFSDTGTVTLRQDAGTCTGANCTHTCAVSAWSANTIKCTMPPVGWGYGINPINLHATVSVAGGTVFSDASNPAATASKYLACAFLHVGSKYLCNPNGIQLSTDPIALECC